MGAGPAPTISLSASQDEELSATVKLTQAVHEHYYKCLLYGAEARSGSRKMYGRRDYYTPYFFEQAPLAKDTPTGYKRKQDVWDLLCQAEKQWLKITDKGQVKLYPRILTTKLYKDLFSLDYNCDALLKATTLQEAWDENNFQNVTCQDANRQMNLEIVIRTFKKEISQMSKLRGKKTDTHVKVVADLQQRVAKIEHSIELTSRVSNSIHVETDAANPSRRLNSKSVDPASQQS